MYHANTSISGEHAVWPRHARFSAQRVADSQLLGRYRPGRGPEWNRDRLNPDRL
jgi:hypothetical protein